MLSALKYLCQTDGTYHDIIRLLIWTVLLIDFAIIGLSVSALLKWKGI